MTAGRYICLRSSAGPRLLKRRLPRLEWLTPPIHEARTDDRCCQLQQRFVDIQPSFKADSQLAKACKPAVRPLHHPAVLAQSLAAFNAPSGNTASDAPPPQVLSATLVVIALVGVQLCWPFTGTPCQACNRRNRIHAPLVCFGCRGGGTRTAFGRSNGPTVLRFLPPHLPTSIRN